MYPVGLEELEAKPGATESALPLTRATRSMGVWSPQQ